jgi:hypothetical protein
MKYIWLVQERGITIAVCDTEGPANKFLERFSNRDLIKKKENIVGDVIGDKFYYYF